MGLDVRIKGLNSDEEYHGSYIYFMRYRNEVANAYNPRIGKLYKKGFLEKLNRQEINEWNSLCDDNLDIFLFHSDCDGKFKPEECKKIYKALENLKVPADYQKTHELWLNMFKYCYKRRVNMWFY